MSGAWEIKASQKVLVYTIHVDTTTIAWAYGLKNLQIPGSFFGLAGMPFDMARNSAVQQFLNTSYEWLFSLDSDVIPPRDAILRLLNHGLPIVSGLYCRRSPPHGVPVMIKGGRWVTQFTPGSMVEVDLVGAGCLLTHRSVFEKVPHQRPGKPWFDWRVDLRGLGVVPEDTCTSEDFSWCQHVRRHGYKIYVDTSVQCRHVGAAQATYNSMVPLESTHNT